MPPCASGGEKTAVAATHLLIDDRVQSLQTGLAEGVAAVKAAGQPARQVVAAKAHYAQQVPPP